MIVQLHRLIVCSTSLKLFPLTNSGRPPRRSHRSAHRCVCFVDCRCIYQTFVLYFVAWHDKRIFQDNKRRRKAAILNSDIRSQPTETWAGPGLKTLEFSNFDIQIIQQNTKYLEKRPTALSFPCWKNLERHYWLWQTFKLSLLTSTFDCDTEPQRSSLKGSFKDIKILILLCIALMSKLKNSRRQAACCCLFWTEFYKVTTSK